MIYSFTDNIPQNFAQYEIYEMTIIEALNIISRKMFISIKNALFHRGCFMFIDQNTYFVEHFDYFLNKYKPNFYRAIMRYKLFNYGFYYYELFSCYKIFSKYEIDLNIYFPSFEQFILFANDLDIEYTPYDIEMNETIEYAYNIPPDEITLFNIDISPKYIKRYIYIKAPYDAYSYYMYKICKLSKNSYKSLLIEHAKVFVQYKKRSFLLSFFGYDKNLSILNYSDGLKYKSHECSIAYLHSDIAGYVYFLKSNNVKMQYSPRLSNKVLVI